MFCCSATHALIPVAGSSSFRRARWRPRIPTDAAIDRSIDRPSIHKRPAICAKHGRPGIGSDSWPNSFAGKLRRNMGHTKIARQIEPSSREWSERGTPYGWEEESPIRSPVDLSFFRGPESFFQIDDASTQAFPLALGEPKRRLSQPALGPEPRARTGSPCLSPPDGLPWPNRRIEDRGGKPPSRSRSRCYGTASFHGPIAPTRTVIGQRTTRA